MKLTRTKEYNFGWLVVFPMIDVVFLLIFFLLLSSNFVLQPGISVALPFSRFTLGPQLNQQIVSITGGAVRAVAYVNFRIQSLGMMSILAGCGSQRCSLLHVRAMARRPT